MIRIALFIGLCVLTACEREYDTSCITYVTETLKDSTLVYTGDANFTGNFSFTVAKEYWGNSSPLKIDDYTFDGTIKTYAVEDSIRALGRTVEVENDGNVRLTIEFMKDLLIIPKVRSNGIFVNGNTVHYSHSGRFVSDNEVIFIINGLGGSASTTAYVVRGIRKQHDVLIKMHDSFVKIDDRLVRMHDSSVKVHDGLIRMHDSSVKIDDRLVRMHDGFVKVNDGLVKIDDSSVKVSDRSVRMGDDSVRMDDRVVRMGEMVI